MLGYGERGVKGKRRGKRHIFEILGIFNIPPIRFILTIGREGSREIQIGVKDFRWILRSRWAFCETIRKMIF